MSFWKYSSLVMLLVGAVGTSSAIAACSNGSLNGSFGTLATAADGTIILLASIGQLNLDGNGNATLSNVISLHYEGGNWRLHSYTGDTGTYSVARNCTGSLVLFKSDGSLDGDLSFIIQSGKQGLQFINTDVGYTGSAVAQGNVTCGLTGSKQTFAANLTGNVIGVGPASYVGQVILDGNGNVSGTMTSGLNGSVAAGPVTGTYTENSDCSGAVTISSTAFGTVNFSFIVVSSGKQLLVVETDPNTVVSGVMLQGQ